MGILNTTPDSFSDGGRYLDKEKAVAHAIRMADEGADIIDVGGESTRPGSKPVTAEEELSRVIPVINELKENISIPISIDTQKSEVAAEAIHAGAHIINDISGLRADPKMKKIAADHNVPVIIMHMKGKPETMQDNPVYGDVIHEICRFFNKQIQEAIEWGISTDKIIIDPGIGFGKTIKDNFRIIQDLGQFQSLDMPILIGLSRKSFIGKVLKVEENERLMGTASAVAAAILNGAHIVRVHDVMQMVQVSRIADFIMKPSTFN